MKRGRGPVDKVGVGVDILDEHKHTDWTSPVVGKGY
jgi:hypothetical protein